MCSVARNVDSNIAGIASSADNLDWKIGTEYTAITGFKYVKSGATEETDIVGKEIKISVLESGSGAVMNTVAAFTAAFLALYAF